MRRLVVFALIASGLAACADPAPEAGSDPPAPDTLEITCDGETTHVLSPTVQARADGVHIRLTNTSDGDVLYQSPLSGDSAAPGTTSLRLSILPGRSRFRCLSLTKDVDPGVEGGWASFEVLPPDGWISPTLDCTGSAYSGMADYVEGARGVSDPVADARKHFRLEGDVVEAGYRDPDVRTFINVQSDGKARESLTYRSDGHGGWLQEESSGCSD